MRIAHTGSWKKIAFVLLFGAAFLGVGTPLSAQLPSFAYAANFNSNTVSAYTVNGIGQLAPMAGSPFAAGTNPVSVAVDPTGSFLYVANYTSNNVSAFTISRPSGALVPVPGSPFAVGRNPIQLLVHPNQFLPVLYVVNSSDNTVSAYAIDTVTVPGPISLLPGGTVTVGRGTIAIGLRPLGDVAYVANFFSNDVYAYDINPANGTLTFLGRTFPVGSGADAVAIDPTSSFVYVTNNFSGDISAYAIDFFTGLLTPIPGMPFATGADPGSVAVTSPAPGTNTFLYAANFSPNNATGYLVDTVSGSGALFPLSPPSTPTGTGAAWVTVDPTGNFVYVANSLSNTISAFVLNASTGALTPVGAAAAGSFPISVVAVP